MSGIVGSRSRSGALGENSTQTEGAWPEEILNHQNSSVSVIDTFGPFLLVIHALYCMLLSDSVLKWIKLLAMVSCFVNGFPFVMNIILYIMISTN